MSGIGTAPIERVYNPRTCTAINKTAYPTIQAHVPIPLPRLTTPKWLKSAMMYRMRQMIHVICFGAALPRVAMVRFLRRP